MTWNVMRRTAVLGLAGLAFAAAPALAQGICASGFHFDWDENGFAYETNYNPVGFNSAAGSQLTIVGVIENWCDPFTDLNGLANTEHTFVIRGTSRGTVGPIPVGPSTFYTTDYEDVTFEVWQNSPPDAPAANAMPLPGGGVVPDDYENGTKILEGQFIPTTQRPYFSVTISQTNGQTQGSFIGNYIFTGPVGSQYYQRVKFRGEGLAQGVWCPVGGCVPNGYSAHVNGKFDVTPVEKTSWGSVKERYR